MDVTVCSTVSHIQVSNICIEWTCHVSLNYSCNHQSFQSHLIYSYTAWNPLSLGQLTNRHDAWNHVLKNLSPANKKMISCLSIWCCKKPLFIHLLYQYRVIKSFAYCFSAFSSSFMLSIVILLLSGVADICIVAPTTSRTTLLFSCICGREERVVPLLATSVFAHDMKLHYCLELVELSLHWYSWWMSF